MSSFTYRASHTRERSPYDSDPYDTPRALVRQNSKRQRMDLYDDDKYDDYPYSSSHKPSQPSRALTVRQPSQLERLGVWSDPKPSYSDNKDRGRRHYSHTPSDDEEDRDRTSRYKYTPVRPAHYYYTHSPSRSDPDPDYDDDRDREYRLKLKATFTRPKSSHGNNTMSFTQKAMQWPGEMFKRREKYDEEGWESREKQRGDTWWEDEQPALREKAVRYRRIKRTRTDEWKPLSGWRKY